MGTNVSPRILGFSGPGSGPQDGKWSFLVIEGQGFQVAGRQDFLDQRGFALCECSWTNAVNPGFFSAIQKLYRKGAQPSFPPTPPWLHCMLRLCVFFSTFFWY